MGCCFSSCRENGGSQDGEVNERTHLLNDPVCNNASIQRVHSDNILSHSPNSLPKKADEQSALNKILQETATNVIDVAALGSHNMEQHEYLERMNQYHSKIALVAGGSWQNPVKRQCLLIDIPNPEKILSNSAISSNNFIMIKRTAQQVRNALANLKVEHKEALVVPFWIP